MKFVKRNRGGTRCIRLATWLSVPVFGRETKQGKKREKMWSFSALREFLFFFLMEEFLSFVGGILLLKIMLIIEVLVQFGLDSALLISRL